MYCFLLIILLDSCNTNTKSDYNSKRSIQNNFADFTNFELDTTNFDVLVDSIHNTEGAFDLDYTWFVKIKLSDGYFNTFKSKIQSSQNYLPSTNRFEIDWYSIDTSTIKGVWYSDSTRIEFVQKPQEYNSEPLYVSIDTLTKIIELILIHL
jgi:hypothetical protein